MCACVYGVWFEFVLGYSLANATTRTWHSHARSLPRIPQHTLSLAALGAKDTAPSDVYEVTYEDYVAPIKKEKGTKAEVAATEG